MGKDNNLKKNDNPENFLSISFQTANIVLNSLFLQCQALVQTRHLPPSHQVTDVIQDGLVMVVIVIKCRMFFSLCQKLEQDVALLVEIWCPYTARLKMILFYKQLNQVSHPKSNSIDQQGHQSCAKLLLWRCLDDNDNNHGNNYGSCLVTFYKVLKTKLMVTQHYFQLPPTHYFECRSPLLCHFIHSLLAGVSSSVWLGLNDLVLQSSFTWTDESEVDFTWWNTGEPNNYGDKGEDCVEMYGNVSL